MEMIGGIGFFLLGMMLLTEGIQSLTSDRFSRFISKITRSKWHGLFSGAVVTALLQSSSATTLLVIGFVNAGLVSFSHSVGLIFGANLGTTITSWFISLVGFNFSIKSIALPLIGIGVFLKFTKGKWRGPVGMALCGFGLIFFGIDFLQLGMSKYSAFLDFTSISTIGIFNKFLLISFGFLMSVVLQSSSAAIATTLVAVHSGSINLETACFLVIGQNVGTTLSAILGSIGASINARRTAWLHVIFNIIASLSALFILPLYLIVFNSWGRSFFAVDEAIGLSFFQTLIQLLGIVILFPFSESLADLIIRWNKSFPVTATKSLVRELSIKEITGTEVALEIMLKKLGESLVLLTNKNYRENFLKSSPEFLNHCYLYISKMEFNDKQNDIRFELLRALENIRNLTLVEVDSESLERLNNLVEVNALQQKMILNQQLMVKAIENFSEYFPDGSFETEQGQIYRDYQALRIELLRISVEKYLDHQTLSLYFDTLKNLLSYHQYLARVFQHLVEVQKLKDQFYVSDLAQKDAPLEVH